MQFRSRIRHLRIKQTLQQDSHEKKSKKETEIPDNRTNQIQRRIHRTSLALPHRQRAPETYLASAKYPSKWDQSAKNIPTKYGEFNIINVSQ